MAYTPNTWVKGDTITSAKMNHMEAGISHAEEYVDRIQGAIDELEAGSLSAVGAAAGAMPVADGEGAWEWQADPVAGEVADLKSAVEDLNNAVSDGAVVYEGKQFKRGYFRNNIGVDVSTAGNKGFYLGPIPVKVGDKILFNTGSMFVNMLIANGNASVKSIYGTFSNFSQPSASEKTIDTAGDLWVNVRSAKTQADANNIENSDIDSTLTVYATLGYKLQERVASAEDDINSINTAIDNIVVAKTTDAQKLFWRYGSYSSSGVFNANEYTLCTPAWINARAGDTITCDSGIRFQVGYITSASSSTFDGYQTFSGDDYTVPVDCRLKIGVRYDDGSSTNLLNNYAILDGLHLNLSSGDVRYRYDSRSVTNLANIPSGLYVGRHTDNNGFGQGTQYDTVIAAWNAYCGDDNDDDSDKYMTKSDLGETYNGNHIYCYTLNPNTKVDASSINTALYGKNKPTVVCVTGMHGHEKSGTYGLLYLIEDLMNHAHEDPVLSYLRSNVCFKFIPACNVYGWNENSRYNEHGVNLNRNWGTKHYNDYNTEDSDEQWEYNYKGSGPFSELETQYIKHVITQLPSATLIVDWHTNGLDTTAWREFAIFNVPYDSSEYEKRVADSAVAMRNLLNPFIGGLYDMPVRRDQIIGNAAIGVDRPTLTNWVHDGTNSLSTLLETSPGSSTGFLGTNLSQYSASVIKMSAEIFVNYVMSILRSLA